MACELLQREFVKSDKETKVLVGVRQLSASAALALQVELAAKFGNNIFPFVENKYYFGDIIHLMRQAESGAVAEVVKRVACMATVDGKEVRPASFDMHYSGELMLVCQVFAFVCEANFLDFFKLGLEINEQRKLEAEEASKLAEQKSSSPEQTS